MAEIIDESAAIAYFERLDPLVRPGTILFVIGGSKLYRYSEQDQEDIQFLMGPGGATLEGVHEAVSRLPMRFRDDVLVRENLANLEADLQLWKGGES